MSEELEQIFGQLVASSWQRYDEYVNNKRMDDMLVGAVITVMVEDGHSLIDITSDGRAHYLRFENLSSKQRYIFRFASQSEDLVTTKVIGRQGRVEIGYGESVRDINKLWSTLKSEMKSQFLDTQEPGVITMDADIETKYIYVQISLLLGVDVYFQSTYEIDYETLRQHITATIHSLQKYLHGRIGL